MKKSMAVLVVLCIILSSSIMVLAEADKLITDKKQVSDGKKIVEIIAKGSDEIVGDGVPLHQNDNDDNDDGVSPKWASGGVDHTHQYLVARAITILENDMGYSAAETFYDNASTILENADWPDENETDGITFKGHFYDVSTGENWLGETSPTAKTRFVYWAELARANYNNDEEYSMQCLGRALHYLADVNEPHHAQNYIAGLSDHTDFEEWVDERRSDYQTTTTNRYTINFGTTWEGICGEVIDYSATQAGQIDFHSNFFGYASLVDSYDDVAAITMDNSQQNIAVFLYNFLEEVGEI